jgi:hypothetical protein
LISLALSVRLVNVTGQYTPSYSCIKAAEIAHLLAYTTITGIRSGSKCRRIGVAAILDFSMLNAIMARAF